MSVVTTATPVFEVSYTKLVTLATAPVDEVTVPPLTQVFALSNVPRYMLKELPPTDREFDSDLTNV